MSIKPVAFAIALLGLAACAGAPKPTQQLTAAKASIRGAREAGAKRVPKGRLHLTMALDQVAAAEALISKEEKLDHAKHLLIRAEAHANLAIVLARAHRALAERARAIEQLEKLQNGSR